MLKRTLIVLLAMLFSTPAFATVVAYGETGNGLNVAQTTQQSTSNDTTTSTDTTPPSSQDESQAKAERDARIKKLRESLKINLTAANKKKIQDRCQASQGKVSSVSGRVKGIETSRSQVHENLLKNLNNIDTKLKAANVDTAELETDIATLKTKIDTFNTDLATYKQALSDLSVLDCKADPEGFQAALQTARTDLEKVRTDAKATESYLKETIKPLLVSLRTKVAQAETPTSGLGVSQ